MDPLAVARLDDYDRRFVESIEQRLRSGAPLSQRQRIHLETLCDKKLS